MIFGVLNPEKIAINRYFSNAGIKDDGNDPIGNNGYKLTVDECKENDDHTYLTSVSISESDIMWAINRMKSSLSCPDNLPPVFFSEIKTCTCIPSGPRI